MMAHETRVESTVHPCLSLGHLKCHKRELLSRDLMVLKQGTRDRKQVSRLNGRCARNIFPPPHPWHFGNVFLEEAIQAIFWTAESELRRGWICSIS